MAFEQDAIAYFYSDHKVVFLRDHAGNRLMVDKNLGELEAVLDPHIFFRINRKVIAYRKAIDLAPNYVDAMNNLASALASKKNWDGAIKVFEQALALEPKASDVRANYASALQNAGRTDDAIAAYRQVVADNSAVLS